MHRSILAQSIRIAVFIGGSVLLTLGMRAELFSPFANISAVATKQRDLFRAVLLVSKFQDRNFL
jgi:hypothetical protein